MSTRLKILTEGIRKVTVETDSKGQFIVKRFIVGIKIGEYKTWSISEDVLKSLLIFLKE